jgi:hypothetical protein
MIGSEKHPPGDVRNAGTGQLGLRKRNKTRDLGKEDIRSHYQIKLINSMHDRPEVLSSRPCRLGCLFATHGYANFFLISGFSAAFPHYDTHSPLETQSGLIHEEGEEKKRTSRGNHNRGD